MNNIEALTAHAGNIGIKPRDIAGLLKDTRGTTFAGILYVSTVATAAAFKHVDIKKVVRANVQVFANLKAATDVYTNAVKRTAANLPNDADAVAHFEKSDNYFTHTEACYSVVKHKLRNDYYLYAFYNSVKDSTYYIDGREATKQEVAAYLTPSAAKKLLEDDSVTYNKKNDVYHSVMVRTIKLDNIVYIRAGGWELSVA